MLDFFAGTAVTARVAIEHGRHSISTDKDAAIKEYFAKHMENWGIQEVFRKAPPFEVLDNANQFVRHPVFSSKQDLSVAAE